MTAGDFTTRVMEMQKTLYHVAYGMLFNSQDCADAVQECILKAWRMRGSLRNEAALKAWITRILIHECINMLRSRKPNISLASLPDMQAPPDADPWLHEAIRTLPEKLRIPVVLYYMEGFTVEQAASILHIPAGTVKTRLAKARSELKKALNEDEGEGSPAYESI